MNVDGDYMQRKKDHFDKVVHLHKQMKMADTATSGFGLNKSKINSSSTTDILRNRAFPNQQTVQGNMQTASKSGKKPLYFVNSSTALLPSNPNSLVDQGGRGKTRNCEYYMADPTDTAAQVTWQDLMENERELDEYVLRQSRRSAA